jgi:hypothetical protein
MQRPIHPHKIKEWPIIAGYTQSVAKTHSQMYSTDLMGVSVPAKDGSQQSATFTHAPWASTEVPHSCLY